MTPARATGTASLSPRDAVLRRLFEVSGEGIYAGLLTRSDSQPAETVFAANPRLKCTLGHTPDADDSEALLFAQEQYADPSARHQLLDALFAHAIVNDHLVQLRRPDGSSVWVEITAHSEATDDGSLRVDALVRDVTERRQLDDRARALYQQLAHSEQIAAIERTLADVAHELRNPLTTIIGWAERLAAQPPLDEKIARGVSEMLAAAERAARIVRNVLHSSSRRPSTRRLVDVNAIVAETLLLRRHDQRALHVTATTALGPAVPAIFADAHQVQQVLLNVIINAEHAMSTAHGRGTLVIRTTADERRQMAIVEVTDDGPGVPEHLRSRIFDPFFTTKQGRSGTGLGLAVAQALVHDHGGSIRLAQDKTEGATFVIELPTRAVATNLS